MKYVTASIVAAVMANSMPPALAHMVEKENVQVIHPWAEASDGATTRVFPTIANTGKSAIVVVGAESAVARRVDLIVNGKTVDQVVVVGGDVAALTDADNHIRLMGLSEPLAEGGHFPLLLTFADGLIMTLKVVIGETTLAPDLSAQGQPSVNVTHDPIPALGWPSMTMDLALLGDATTDNLAPGDGIVFELERGADRVYGIARIWPAGSEPTAAEDAVRGHGTLNAVSGE
jgi:copper(I)-binding protein